jgi:hypothetical protein
MQDSLFNFCGNLGVQAVGLLVLLVVQISVELTWQKKSPSLLHESFKQFVAMLTKKFIVYAMQQYLITIIILYQLCIILFQQCMCRVQLHEHCIFSVLILLTLN